MSPSFNFPSFIPICSARGMETEEVFPMYSTLVNVFSTGNSDLSHIDSIIRKLALCGTNQFTSFFCRFACSSNSDIPKGIVRDAHLYTSLPFCTILPLELKGCPCMVVDKLVRYTCLPPFPFVPICVAI